MINDTVTYDLNEWMKELEVVRPYLSQPAVNVPKMSYLKKPQLQKRSIAPTITFSIVILTIVQFYFTIILFTSMKEVFKSKDLGLFQCTVTVKENILQQGYYSIPRYKTIPHLYVSVGPKDIATEIGLTNGTMGKVIAYGFSNNGTTLTSEFIQPKDFHTINSSKSPIIIYRYFKGFKTSNNFKFRYRPTEATILFGLLTEARLKKNCYHIYCDQVRTSLDYRWDKLKIYFKINRISKHSFQLIQKYYGSDNFSFLDPFMRVMFTKIFHKRWDSKQNQTVKYLKYIGYPPIENTIDTGVLYDLLTVEDILSKHFTTPITLQQHTSALTITYLMENILSDSKPVQMLLSMYQKVSQNFFYYVIDSNKTRKSFDVKSPRSDQGKSRKAYKTQDKPRKPRVEDRQRKAYTSQDKPRKPRAVEDRPRKAYKTQDKPRKVYTPRRQRSDKGLA